MPTCGVAEPRCPLQVWSVAIGCFFGWWAFPMLICMLAVGVPLPFLIGRRLARGDRVAVWLRSRAPGAMRARMDLCRSRCVCAACTLRVHAHTPRATHHRRDGVHDPAAAHGGDAPRARLFPSHVGASAHLDAAARSR